MRIETQRLLLRPLAVDDAPALARLFAGDWETIKQTGRMPWPPTEAALRKWISVYVAPASHSFLMASRRDRVAIGGIGFGGDGGTAELGYVLGRQFWGRGYATEGVGAMLTHAALVGYRVLEAFSFIENPASARVLEKAGFTDLGVFERHYPERGGLRQVRRFTRRLTFARRRG
jgi:RimJ/RimL family protein N-acetyltransferase